MPEMPEMPEMSDEQHESADLTDYEVLDSTDTLDGAPGDDPLDRGVATPDRWSAGMKFGSTAAEQEAGESLAQLLAAEEPDEALDVSDDQLESVASDENATEEEISRSLLNQGPDPRTGRLVAEDEDDYPAGEDDLFAHDAGIDGGGATAEEAAVHLVVDDESQPGEGL
jgi:hypothetical protein